MSVSRASQALNEWLDTTGTMQVDFAEKITQFLAADSGETLEHPVHQSSVSSWTRGQSKPRAPTMIAIEAITGVPIAWWTKKPIDAESGPSLASADETGEQRASMPTGTDGS